MAWVGLIPFFMVVATAGDRTAPWVSRFPETNVRTYVRDSDGHVGIWFFSLDAARFGAVAVAPDHVPAALLLVRDGRCR